MMKHDETVLGGKRETCEGKQKLRLGMPELGCGINE